MFKPVLHLPENEKGRDFFVGDIHGAFHLVDQALAEVKFDPARDRLISVGDLIDRGPENLRALEFLKQPWFHAIRGNHEDIFLRIVTPEGLIDPDRLSDPKFVKNLIENGCAWIATEDMNKLCEMREAFKDLPLVIELDTKEGKIGFAHGDVPALMGWEKFKQRMEEGNPRVVHTCLWGRNRVLKKRDSGVQGVSRVYFGHTPQEGGATMLGNCYYIDTGAVYSMMPENKGKYCLTLGEVTADSKDILRKHGKEVYTITQQQQISPKPLDGRIHERKSPRP